MKLPTEIRPNPLVTTVVEVRYLTNRSIGEILPLVITKFIEELPKGEPNTKLPPEIKNSNPQFKFLADYILSNDDYKFTFSSNAFAFEVVSDYKLWPDYFSFIKRSLKKFYSLGHIQSIHRIGVRYASVLSNTTDVWKVLNSVPKIALGGYEEQFDFYRCKLKAGQNNLLLQLVNNAVATRPGNRVSGIYIDIDASFEGSVSNDDDILYKIEELHQEEKKLFFSLLKQDFIATLNPRY